MNDRKINLYFSVIHISVNQMFWSFAAPPHLGCCLFFYFAVRFPSFTGIHWRNSQDTLRCGILLAGDGNDVLNGGADFDFLDGGDGKDSAFNGERVINVP